MNYIAIMAGGVGSRFWPGSRESRPKQFIDMMGVGKSLLRLTFERFLPIVPASNIFIVTNSAYRELIMEHIPELSPNQIICEPSRNNTAPSVAYTALKLAALDPKANFVMAPSDHIILKESIFLDKIKEALSFTAQHEAIVTLGIQPNRPDTGYGYIQYGEKEEGEICAVSRFTEKPNLETAKAFLESGEYLWNAGIFVWSARTVLRAYRQFAPEILDILDVDAVYNTPEEQEFIDTHYPETPNISVDFAILEKAKNVFTIPSEFGWSDLGTWNSLHAECGKDETGNVLQGDKIVALDSDNCLIRMPKDKMAVVKGLSDYIVVDDGDILLIYPKSKEQEIKKVNEMVKNRFGSQYI